MTNSEKNTYKQRTPKLYKKIFLKILQYQSTKKDQNVVHSIELFNYWRSRKFIIFFFILLLVNELILEKNTIKFCDFGACSLFNSLSMNRFQHQSYFIQCSKIVNNILFQETSFEIKKQVKNTINHWLKESESRFTRNTASEFF